MVNSIHHLMPTSLTLNFLIWKSFFLCLFPITSTEFRVPFPICFLIYSQQWWHQWYPPAIHHLNAFWFLIDLISILCSDSGLVQGRVFSTLAKPQYWRYCSGCVIKFVFSKIMTNHNEGWLFSDFGWSLTFGLGSDSTCG